MAAGKGSIEGEEAGSGTGSIEGVKQERKVRVEGDSGRRL